MIFVTGGAYQGKRPFAKQLTGLPDACFVDGAVCTREEALQAAAIDHLHLLIRRLLSEGEEPEAFVRELLAAERLQLVLSDEVGCGVVPIDPFERRFRDEAGRAGQMLAAQADEVYRVYCGIGKRIK